MLLKLGLFLCFVSLLFGTKRVELFENNPVVNYAYYTKVLQKHHIDAIVVPGDLDIYPALAKKRTFWAKYLRRFNLDFPRKVDLPEDVLKIVFNNITVHHYRDTQLRKLPKEKLVLFMWEPFTVIENMYSPILHEKFSKVYTWDDSLVDNKKYFKFYYAVLTPMLETLPSFEEKKFCTLVATNIAPRYSNSLYGERRKAIEFFEKVGEEGFEFYGRQWDPKVYKSYRGAIANKIETIKNYRFAICYENSLGNPGYVTEKIFDCFAAGIIPVYWGAPNIEDYVPADCFIDRRKFTSLEELYAFLKKMSKDEYEGYISRIRAYLKSDKAQLFSLETFEKIFASAIEEPQPTENGSRPGL